MTLEKAFGLALKGIRLKHSLSQEELGLESGYHRTYISLLERGGKSPSLNTIFQLARALKTKPSEMLRQVEARIGEVTKRDTKERRKAK